jgi:predicted kinase
MQILVGLPGSGKSTYAAEKVSQGWVRVNYDSIRHESDLFPGGYHFSKDNENRVKHVCLMNAAAALRDGLNVVVDNTNLTEKSRIPWFNLAQVYQLDPEIIEFNTPLDECLRRNAARTGWARVPRPVIERMALWNGRIDWPTDKKIVIVDMDGTLSDTKDRQKYVDGKCKDPDCRNGLHIVYDTVSNCPVCGGTGREKKNWNRFFEEVSNDQPNKVVLEWVKSLEGAYYVCVVSGRPLDRCGNETEEWLNRHQVPYNRLFMRAAGDNRDDTIIKKEILDRMPKNMIAYSIDDRPRVIRMWRENGIRCYDVGNGIEF